VAAFTQGSIPAFHRQLDLLELLGSVSGFTKLALRARTYAHVRRTA
jgi:hypothetical protein